MEACKRRLAGDTARAATTGEVQDYRLLKTHDLITSPAYVVIRRGPHSANLRRELRQMF